MAFFYTFEHSDNIYLSDMVKSIPPVLVKAMGFSSDNEPFHKILVSLNQKVTAEVFYSVSARNHVYNSREYSPEIRELCENIGIEFNMGMILFSQRKKEDPSYSMNALLKEMEYALAIPELKDEVVISFAACHDRGIAKKYKGDIGTVSRIIKRNNNSTTFTLLDKYNNPILNLNGKGSYEFTASELILNISR